MTPKTTIESFITAASERSCQHIENETAANEGEVGELGWRGGEVIRMLWRADKNGMSNFIFSPPPPPTSCFAWPPLKWFLLNLI